MHSAAPRMVENARQRQGSMRGRAEAGTSRKSGSINGVTGPNINWINSERGARTQVSTQTLTFLQDLDEMLVHFTRR